MLGWVYRRGEGRVRWGGGGGRGGQPGETRSWREGKVLERSQTFCRRAWSVVLGFSRLPFHHRARIEASAQEFLTFLTHIVEIQFFVGFWTKI